MCNKGEMSHALATLNSNNFVVYDQKHKVLHARPGESILLKVRFIR